MSKPPGRALEIQAEFSLLGKRIEFLENLGKLCSLQLNSSASLTQNLLLVTELGGGDKIPPPLRLQHAARRPSSFSKEVESQIEHASSLQGLTEEREGDHGGPDLNGTDEEGEKGASGVADEEEAKLIIGVGSLSIGDDNTGRYLGASAAPAYFFDDEVICCCLSHLDFVFRLIHILFLRMTKKSRRGKNPGQNTKDNA